MGSRFPAVLASTDPVRTRVALVLVGHFQVPGSRSVGGGSTAVGGGGTSGKSPGLVGVCGGGAGMACSVPQMSSTLSKIGSSGGLVSKFRFGVGIGAGVVALRGTNIPLGFGGKVLLVPLVILRVFVVSCSSIFVVKGQPFGVGGGTKFGRSLGADFVDLVVVTSHVLPASAVAFHVGDGVLPVFAAPLLS